MRSLRVCGFVRRTLATSKCKRRWYGPSVKPADAFYCYANGKWLATVALPTGQTSLDNRAMMNEKTGQRVRELIQSAAASNSTHGGVAQKVGDFCASFMDQEGIEAKGMTPLAGEMATIAAISNKASLSAYLGASLKSEVDGLTANADHVFGVWINQGFEDSKHNLPHLWQGGLGMPNRDTYLDPSPKMAELRGQYQAHMATVLKLAGIADSDAKAARILSLEVRIAKAFAPDSDAADTFKQNNTWQRADFPVKAPGMDWSAYFQSAGLSEQSAFTVWQPTAVTGVPPWWTPRAPMCGRTISSFT
jgi:putative endopeptidase